VRQNKETESMASEEEYTRVRTGIAGHVIDFCRSRVGSTFRADELRQYVVARTKRAPASPDRILRGLRDEGVVLYTVEDRGASLYAVQAVDETASREERKARALNASAARDAERLAGKLRRMGYDAEAREAERWAKMLEPPPVEVDDGGQAWLF
tara:strand:- start:608 stop:1069 length:462 start_codon:yes stop_codon:yes gene_type:complete